MPRYIDQLKSSYVDIKEQVFDDELKKEAAFKKDLLSRSGKKTSTLLHDELADAMVSHATVKRNNKDLLWTLNKIKEIRERYKNISLDDRSSFANQTTPLPINLMPCLKLH